MYYYVNIYVDLLRAILTTQLNDSILKPSLAQFCEIDHCSLFFSFLPVVSGNIALTPF